jgi:hypothetical protein
LWILVAGSSALGAPQSWVPLDLDRAGDGYPVFRVPALAVTTAGTLPAMLLAEPRPPATEAPTLCFGQQCDQSYTLDPARHLLAAEPHLVFRLSDLRPDTRMGNVIRFRLALDLAPDELQAIAVFTTQERPGELREEWLVEILRPNAVGTWDFSRGCIGCRPTTTVRVYFFTR